MPSRRLDLPESSRPLHAELQLYTDSATVSVATRYLIAGYLLVGGAVVLLVLLVSKRVSGRIVEPLASLSETADSIVSLQRLDLRAPEVGADEPARLAKSFNKMLDSLQLAQAHLIDDIARREQIEEALRRSNRQLRMISDCNQVLICSSDESELVNTVCRIIVEVGGYDMAHVVYSEGDKARTLPPVVAHSSRKEGLLDEWNIDSADSERAGGAHDTAIRSGQPCVIQDIGSDPRFAPGSVAVGERGYAAVCALPLLAQSRTLGALSIYSVTADAFDPDEVVLLSELAGNLAFGIAVLRVRVQRDQADKALRESEFFLRRSQGVGDLGSYYFDARTGTWISSEKLDQIFGIDDSFPKTIAGWTDLVHPGDRKEMLEHLGDHVQKIVDGAGQVAEANLAWLLVRDQETRAFLLTAQRGLPEVWAKRMNQPMGDGVSSFVAASGETLTMTGAPLQKFRIANLGKAICVVPIKVQAEVIGLSIVVRKEARPFSKTDETLLEAVADYASISLVNARLFKILNDTVHTARESEQRQNTVLETLRASRAEELQAAMKPVEVLLAGGSGPLAPPQGGSRAESEDKALGGSEGPSQEGGRQRPRCARAGARAHAR